MRIIKHGIMPDEYLRWHERHCRHCSCVYEHQQRDVQESKHAQQHGPLYVTCPECGVAHVVTKEDL